MEPKKYKVTLKSRVEFRDYSKEGEERYVSMDPGDYQVTIIPNPIYPGASDWMVFAGTTVGATIDYFKSKSVVMG